MTENTVHVGTINYSATGEGSTVYIFAKKAENKETFLKEMQKCYS